MTVQGSKAVSWPRVSVVMPTLNYVLRRLRPVDAVGAAVLGRRGLAARAVGRPVHAQGVTRIDDAKRAVDAGVTAISVSDRSGNNLDGTPTTIRLLPDIAKSVGDQVEVLMDGGIRPRTSVPGRLGVAARPQCACSRRGEPRCMP